LKKDNYKWDEFKLYIMPDDLQDLSGVGKKTAQKLKEFGYDDFEVLAVKSPDELVTDTNLSENKARKIIRGAKNKTQDDGFKKASDMEDKKHVSTGVDSVDHLFGGGFETQGITELYGQYGTGKSQLAFQACVNVQLPEELGGLRGSVVHIDTESSFSKQRIKDMVKGLDDEVLEKLLELENIDGTAEHDSAIKELQQKFLSRVHVRQVASTSEQIRFAQKAMKLGEEETELPVKLMVVDSLIGHFRGEYVGRGALADRQQTIKKHMRDISNFTLSKNAAAIITNQVQSDPGQQFGDPTKPVGGNIVGHHSTNRVYLKKSKKNTRIAKLVDSNELEEGETKFEITKDGIKEA
jgi:DNA repair protein RadA